jgi:uncharacterized protein with NRDE domain
MCTIIFDWQPNSFIVGANRDENPLRPSQPWMKRGRGVFCPLDVRGGTWIGVNERGMFLGIVNHDLGHVRGMQSRGVLLLDALKCDTGKEAEEFLLDTDPRKYNGFYIVLVYNNVCKVFEGNYNYPKVRVDEHWYGVHILTNDGMDYPEDNKYKFIKKNLPDKIGYQEMMNLMSLHGPEGKYDYRSICAHDMDHAWETVSSSIIQTHLQQFKITDIHGRPCDVSKNLSIPFLNHSLEIVT